MTEVRTAVAAVVTLWFGLGVACAQPVSAPTGANRIAVLHADGVQIYACEAREGAGPVWAFKAPEAWLFDGSGRQVGTHGAGPVWRLAADNSAVLGAVAANAPAPQAGAIPWLLLRARAHEGEGAMRPVAFIRRIDTVGGIAPATGCDATSVGTQARMRYSAVYEFFTAAP